MNFFYGKYIKEREDIYGNFNMPFFTYDEISSIVGEHNLYYISIDNGDPSKLYNAVMALYKANKSSIVLCSDNDMHVTKYYGLLYAFFSNISLRLSKMYDYKDNCMVYDDIEVRQYVPSSNEIFIYKLKYARKRKDKLYYNCYVYNISISNIERKYNVQGLSNYFLSFTALDNRSELLLENNIDDKKYDSMYAIVSKDNILEDLHSFISKQSILNDNAARMRVF